MRYIIPAAIILVLIIYFFMLSGDDTAEIEKTLDDMIESAREKDREGLLDSFSKHYKDNNGYNYLVIKKIIDNAFKEYGSLDGSYENLSVTLGEDENGEKTANAKLGVKAVGVRNGIPENLLGTEDSYDEITVRLKKSSLGSWKIVEIEDVDKHGNH